MNVAALIIMALCLVIAAALVPVAGRVGYNRGLGDGQLFEADRQARKRLEAPPVPYECPHLWEPWGKAKWRMTAEGWARIQRRSCGQCGEEQERIV
jgi:hypothetical protein